MDSTEPDFLFQRTPSLSHADLRRLMPRVLAGAEVSWHEQGLVARWPEGRTLLLSWAAEIERRIASLRIVSTPLEFRFTAWTTAQREAFLLRCERALQQGGG